MKQLSSELFGGFLIIDKAGERQVIDI